MSNSFEENILDFKRILKSSKSEATNHLFNTELNIIKRITKSLSIIHYNSGKIPSNNSNVFIDLGMYYKYMIENDC